MQKIDIVLPGVQELTGVDSEIEEIMHFISHYENTPISNRDVSNATGIPSARVKEVLRDLVGRNLIVEGESSSEPVTSYSIGQSPNLDTKNEDNISRYLRKLESSVMEFITVTRSTDVLAFLDWLEGSREDERV